MPKKIFISSSSKDRKAALMICAAIEGRGHACWISSRDVGPGENFQEAIVRAIRDAGLMVLVFSANANNSDEIKKEVALAGQNRLAVLPVRIEDVVPSEAFSYELATRQWIDVFGDWEQAMQQLLAHIANLLPASERSLPPAPPASSSANSPVRKSSAIYWAAGSLLVILLALAGWRMTTDRQPGTIAATRTPVSVEAVRDSGTAKSPPQTVTPARQAVTDPAQLELAYWQSIKDSQDPADFKAYLQQYPQGTFAALARTRVAKAALKAPKPAATAAGNSDTQTSLATKSVAAAAPAATLEATAPGAPMSGKFDGHWMVTLACPRSSDGAMPYSYDFNADVENAVLHGERNATGQGGGALVLDGHIGADGAAELQARGLVGRTGYAVNNLSQGASFTHAVSAHFDVAQGTGSWVANRVCNFTFKKM